jgi:hypothetical protein
VSSIGEEVFFKIKRSTKLSKLQGAYANKVGKDVSSIRFVVYDSLQGDPFGLLTGIGSYTMAIG